jgi:hypothetical protein
VNAFQVERNPIKKNVHGSRWSRNFPTKPKQISAIVLLLHHILVLEHIPSRHSSFLSPVFVYPATDSGGDQHGSIDSGNDSRTMPDPIFM